MIRIPAWDVRLNTRAVVDGILGRLPPEPVSTAVSDAPTVLDIVDEFQEDAPEGATSDEVA